MKNNKRFTAVLLCVAVIVSLFAVCPTAITQRARALDDTERISVIPAGTPFGIKFYTKGVVVSGITDIQTYEGAVSPARDAGISIGDIITAIDEKSITMSDELSEIVSESEGKELVFTVTRGDDEIKFAIKPVKAQDDGIYKVGIWVRDSAAGIGTMTYVSADGKYFAGLGHGVCDSKTGECLPLRKGLITEVSVTDVIKGRRDDPGELQGEFSAYRLGTVTANTECGLFGKLDSSAAFMSMPLMETALRDEVTEGTAYIMTTVSGKTPSMYEIKITKVFRNNEKTKNFLIEVTDKNLLAVTGGIVQGMSGSPVIQNGRIVGAVTHVLVSDPTKGYGIFIENMLEAQSDNNF